MAENCSSQRNSGNSNINRKNNNVRYQHNPSTSMLEAPYLPPETLHEIFNYVGSHDARKLHSCILVNKSWCASAVPIMWKRPFEIASVMSSAKLIATYFMFFSQKTRDYLKNSHNIDISLDSSHRQPFIDYVLLLRHIDFRKIYRAVRIWIRHKSLHEPFDLEVKNKQIEQANCLIKELGKLFTNGSARVDILSLDIRNFEHDADSNRIEFMSWPCSSEQYNSLCDLREFVCGGKFSKNKIISKLTGLCRDLESISLEDSADTTPKFLADFIWNQRRLQKFTLSNWKGEWDLTCIATQAKTLRHIEFIRCKFPKSEKSKHYFDRLAQCYNLETMKFEQCKNLGTKLMRPLAQIEFKNLHTLHIDNDPGPDPPTTEIQSIIVNSKDSLKEIILNVKLSLYTDVLDTISANCPKLSKLSVVIESDREMRQLIMLVNHCTQILELIIPRKWILIEMKKPLLELGAVIPPSLKKLELCGIRFELTTWDEFLNLCPGSINSFVFNCFRQKTYISSVEKYANRHNKVVKSENIVEMYWLPEHVSMELE
ncbi:14938_t:CDS:1 [Acaulospora morrowiae]|uniref:14938_t:CDS:1 n=1 Tax=Acaulospora morrowiae TaxID=94023 RepID=A0A9N9AD89_9GLOM|nr:14938_t:CDS:1 [Acaulospora morrowiae]